MKLEGLLLVQYREKCKNLSKIYAQRCRLQFIKIKLIIQHYHLIETLKIEQKLASPGSWWWCGWGRLRRSVEGGGVSLSDPLLSATPCPLFQSGPALPAPLSRCPWQPGWWHLFGMLGGLRLALEKLNQKTIPALTQYIISWYKLAEVRWKRE